MAPRLTAGVRPIDPSTDLIHGQEYVVNWLNRGKNKRELWIGVHVPHDIAPKQMTSNPPKTHTAVHQTTSVCTCSTYQAKTAGKLKPQNTSENLIWEVTLAYNIIWAGWPQLLIFMLITRYTSAWIEKKYIFPVLEDPPSDCVMPGAEDGKLYQSLHELASQGKSLKFWIAMAKKERAEKGLQNREPYLVMPLAEEIQNVEIPSDDDDDDVETRDETPVAKRVKLTPPVTLDGAEIVNVYVGEAQGRKVFQLTGDAISNSSFLQENMNFRGSPPFVMHPMLLEMDSASFEPIVTFLTQDSVDSDMELVREPQGEHILGDVLGIEKTYVLRNFQDENHLNEFIHNLGKTYEIATVFGLYAMKKAIVKKLQVAWNMYSGKPQILSFLKTIDFVAEKVYASAYETPGDAKDPLLQWAVDFLGGLFMVLVTTHTKPFTIFLKSYPRIQAAILKSRAALCVDDIEPFGELEDELMSQECLGNTPQSKESDEGV
ncbi:hypothetical protein BGW36DRAFT_409045 [Talaromyces proteolyticus]|uniref:Uncharacterized protein n=1 Tax=Talaromyces proteolyticus TaxID=1131652 RepID=A0AAD4KNB2_9EURO|nr:uncharacterized protein BGW36DRAFT_409045 [Talaromyces proteolyticus]KAH8695467.1 hypothetical protein BGW36DRAFT_409045 [Talaromyces proteolyticus]